MGKRKKWRLNLLSGHSAALAVLSIMFLVGSVIGCVGVGLFADEQDLVRSGMSAALSASSRPTLWACMRCSGTACLIAFALAFTVLGIVGLPILFLVRGFMLCYAIGVLYHLWGLGGLCSGLILFGIPALFWMPALFILGAQGLPASCQQHYRRSGKGALPYPGRFWTRCAVCALLVFLCSCVEYTCIPAFLQMINRTFPLF